MRITTFVLTLGLLTSLVLAGCSDDGHDAASTTPATDEPAVSAARAFLGRYVEHDGRVVRRDQGGDTVSEGQGYALLLAVAVGDETAFRRVWSWTRHNLQQPSGLFAYRWADGAVADDNPAADADLQIAWALTLGGKRFHDGALTAEAKRVATAIAAHEIGYDDQGAPVLAAGPWAVRPGQPTVAEPGYWTPRAQQALAALTGDRRLRDLTAAGLTHLRAVTRDGATLPPDWVRIGSGQAGEPIGGPDGGGPVRSGPDGQRALVWSACQAEARPLLQRWWPLLAESADQAPVSRALDGSPAAQDQAPLGAVAAAAAARAAGDADRSRALLARARQIDHQYPTYYGAAWVALGEVLLTTDRLGSCRAS